MINIKPFVLGACISLSFLLALGAQTPQIVRGPYLQMGSDTEISVLWRTDIPTDSRLWWGNAVGSLNSQLSLPGARTDHELRITSLNPRSQYFYGVGDATHGILSGDDSQHYFRTAPPTGAPDRQRFWVLGDSGTANQKARDVRDAFLNYEKSTATNFMIMLGDNAYNDGTDLEYQTAVFQNMYEEILKRCCLWSCYGNHDAHSANAGAQTGPYFDIFSLPRLGEVGGLASGTEAYYSFDQGNIHFVVLDSQTSDRSPTGAMATWLSADLASTNQDWIIAFWHHPPYSKGTHDSDAETQLIEMRQNLVPILELGGVDLVLCGHSHGYERSMLLNGHHDFSPNFNISVHAIDPSSGRMIEAGPYTKPKGAAQAGGVFVVAGSSGKIGAGGYNHPVMVSSMATLGSLVIDVIDQQMTLRFLDARGYLQDFFTMAKAPVRPTQMIRVPCLYGADWLFDDTGTDLGTAWRQPGFDDSNWTAMGYAPLGYGEPWINTTLSFGSDPNQVPPTAYFRKHFNFDGDPTAVEVMQLAALYDDGIVCYLNGQEIARSASMPAGAPTFSTLAASHEASDYEFFDVSAHHNLLVRGQNVIAVEVHQTSASSSDLAFDLALLTDGLDLPFGPAASSSVLDAQGQPEDLFRIQASTGGIARSVDVGVNQPFSFTIDPPSTVPGGAPFTLFGYFGTPSAAETFPLPFNLGPMAFPPAFPGVFAPSSFIIADNLVGLVGALAYSSPAPWAATNPGLNFPGEFSFQGWIATAGGNARVFNAVRLRVLP